MRKTYEQLKRTQEANAMRGRVEFIESEWHSGVEIRQFYPGGGSKNITTVYDGFKGLTLAHCERPVIVTEEQRA